MRFSFLEKVDHIETTRVWLGLWEGGESHVADLGGIFGIIGNQHSHEEHTNEVDGVVGCVNRDARVSSSEDAIDSLFIQDCITGHGKYIIDGCHDRADGFRLQVEDSRNDCDFIFIQTLSRALAE